MTYSQFKNQYQHLPIINARDIIEKHKKQVTLNQFNRWQQKGWIIRIKRGVYLFNKNDRKVQASRPFLANQLCFPSYVSLEYALNFYGLIPEAVFALTSVTTKKTNRFANAEGNFIYQHIKPVAFRGFISVKDDFGFSYFIAQPEKAIIDFFYLNLPRFKTGDADIFEKSYRFQNLESIRTKLLLDFTVLFSNDRLMRVVKLFCQFLKTQKAK